MLVHTVFDLLGWLAAGLLGLLVARLKLAPTAGRTPFNDPGYFIALGLGALLGAKIGRASCRESDWSSDVCSSDLAASLERLQIIQSGATEAACSSTPSSTCWAGLPQACSAFSLRA